MDNNAEEGIMRREILELLRSNMPNAVSGEEISNKFGVSRTAVWKHIQALKNAGYEIEAIPKKGYVLVGTPDKLNPEEIEAVLKTKWLGRNMKYVDSVNSTNELAKAEANKGCADGFMAIAEEQVSGKGRLARGWFSPHGHGCWVSVVLRPPFMPEEAPKCTLMAAIAVVKAVNKYKGVHASIKWPNDVLLNGKKMVGILTEMNAEFGKINYIVIGTGINVNVPKKLIPEDLKDLAISIADAAEEPVRRIDVLADYLKNLEDLYETVLKKGFEPIFAEWRKYNNTLGQEVKVISLGDVYYGKAIDIDPSGLLIVQKKDGTIEKVIAGDVSIRPANAKGRRYQ
jgi:BirA family biotin operon repressor/biotin-[acetyl-CoA-carboxylase] ligase